MGKQPQDPAQRIFGKAQRMAHRYVLEAQEERQSRWRAWMGLLRQAAKVPAFERCWYPEAYTAKQCGKSSRLLGLCGQHYKIVYGHEWEGIPYQNAACSICHEKKVGYFDRSPCKGKEYYAIAKEAEQATETGPAERGNANRKRFDDERRSGDRPN